MKAFKKHWCVRPLSYMLSLYLVVLPLVLTFLAGGIRAQAQVIDLTRTALPQWAVLDFSNDSGYGGAEIGRQASDSFVLELGKSNKIDVVPRQQILESVQNLGLTLPLDSVATQKLGRDLNVDAVVTGNVATVAFDNNPRRATVSVVVRVVDTNTGLLINGAIAQGVSTPRPIPTNDDDALVNQAIDNATFAAVRQIINYSLPRATVMQDEDENTVLLNKGTKDGLYDGLDMVVTRHGSEVGRIRVSRAGTDNSDAVVTVRGAGIAPEDVATAIFQLPRYSYTNDHKHIVAEGGGVVADSTTSGRSTKRSQFSGIGGILASILIGALLLSLVKRGNGSGALGGGQIGSPTAVEIGAYDPTGVAVVGGQAPGPQATPTISGDNESITDYSPVAMHITASHGNVDPFLLQEYHVFRPDFNGNPLYEFPSTTRVITPVQIANTPGQIAILSEANPVLDTWDDGADKVINYTTLGAVSQTTVNITSGGNFVLGSGIHQNIMGKRWAYGIEALWQNTQGTSSGLLPPGNPQGFALTARSSTNSVTYLQPVNLIQAPSDPTNPSGFTGVSANKVLLTVRAVMTADDYVLEISNTPAFTQKLTYKPYNSGLIQTNAATVLAPRGGPSFAFFDPNTGIDMTKVDAQLGNAPALYARIGVRDSRNGTNTKYNPYLYSQTESVPSALI